MPGPYVRNAWYVAGWSHELEAGTPFPASVLDEPIVVYRTDSGRLAALEDRCVHRLAPLSLGRCEGERLRCMYHGLLYDPEGRVVEIPGQDLVPQQARVKSYPAANRHGWIWLWMGDPSRADAALIPPVVGLDHPDYILGHGQLDYAAEARLINDNLLDFSHLTYVHANSFGAGSEFARSLPRVEPLDRGVRFSRWVEGTHGQSSRRSEVPVDAFTTYDFLIPGVLLMWSGQYARGTAEALGFAAPRLEDAIRGVSFTSQAVTPTGPKNARYFYSWGPHRRHGDAAMRDTLMELAAVAFGEDKRMIEAQQKVIDRTPDQRIMPTAHDKGVTLFNRLVERLAKQDSNPAPTEKSACR